MKHLFILVIVLFLIPVEGFAQVKADRGLVVSGNVVYTRPVCINDKPAAAIGVYIQFRNEGDAPILLIPPETPYFEFRVKFVGESSGNSAIERVTGDSLTYNPYLDDPFGTSTVDDYDPKWRYVAELRESQEPLKQIAPGGYFEFQHTLLVRNGFRFQSTSSKGAAKCDADNLRLIPDFPYFTVEYYLSVEKYDRGTELLRMLQQRWRAFGDLPLDDKGNVSYRSRNVLLSKEGK